MAKKDKQVGLALEEADWNALRAIADLKGLQVATMARVIVKEYLLSHPELVADRPSIGAPSTVAAGS